MRLRRVVATRPNGGRLELLSVELLDHDITAVPGAHDRTVVRQVEEGPRRRDGKAAADIEAEEVHPRPFRHSNIGPNVELRKF
jgi:hypothetical protein